MRMGDTLILGGHGQVGRAVASLADKRGLPYRALSRAECDVTDRRLVDRAIDRASFVVNCAAYTDVDAAELECERAYQVNAVACEHIAAACARAGVALVHLSTDYIFDGASRHPWREQDQPRPLGVYGRSKLAGEIAVRARLSSHIILRASWIFSAHGRNFVKTIRRLAKERSQLSVINDQVGGPTDAADLAAAILEIIAQVRKPAARGAWGTYHFSGCPPVSRYEFARAIVSDRPDVTVSPISTSECNTAARRPANSVLDCRRLARVFGIAQPDWRPALRRVLDTLTAGADAA
jgi:dTDP-4-dehydrorhamnose reductase